MVEIKKKKNLGISKIERDLKILECLIKERYYESFIQY
jgi:hypothetical protein